MLAALSAESEKQAGAARQIANCHAKMAEREE
jgi:hypothetical protein